ncbi:hypothetical protein ULG90_08230 [Halopseudomonas pachastrellae]|nr:hypothetical protein ULG90_08230 [Halopseudomonas pachastrellae]
MLEPLELAHTAALQRAVADGESWKLWYASVPTPESMPEYVERAVQGMEQGNLAYAVRSLAAAISWAARAITTWMPPTAGR